MKGRSSENGVSDNVLTPGVINRVSSFGAAGEGLYNSHAFAGHARAADPL